MNTVEENIITDFAIQIIQKDKNEQPQISKNKKKKSKEKKNIGG